VLPPSGKKARLSIDNAVPQPKATPQLAITNSAPGETVRFFADGKAMDEVSRIAYEMLNDSEDEEEADSSSLPANVSAATAEKKPKDAQATNPNLKAAVKAAVKAVGKPAEAAAQAAAQAAEAAAQAAKTAARRKQKGSFKKKQKRRNVPKVAEKKKAAQIEVLTAQAKEKTKQVHAVTPSPKKPKVTPSTLPEPPSPKDEPEAKLGKTEAAQKKAEKTKKLLDLQIAEMFHPDLMAKLIRDKEYTAQQFYVCLRKPEQKNKQTNKQTNNQTNKQD
jgi:hypothetical protein